MGRLHPEFHEPVTENILNFIEELIQKIEENANKDPGKMINEFIEKYKTKRKIIKHKFSVQLINDVKNIINGILEANEDYFINTQEKNKIELIDCCVDYFIERYNDFYPNIEIKDEDEYIRMHHAALIKVLDRLKSSPSSLFDIKKWLVTQLKDDWCLVESIWDDFKENRINTFDFLKNAFEILGEKIFYKSIIYNPKIQETLKQLIR
ncbi:MAG: hypothetical protein ACW98D_11490 [Promethearchaeota archaeon]|jgi:hypothetical protein